MNPSTPNKPRLGLAAFQRRILFRGAFLLLALATLALALMLLADEKQRSYQSYQKNFGKTLSEITAKLRHPAGQLALLNPANQNAAATPLRPLLLPYGALDFDDPNKARQAVETAGCSVQYPDGASLCVAVGNNPYAGGFIYLVGSFFSGKLVGRERGGNQLEEMHRARVTLTMRGGTTRWIAPFEASFAAPSEAAASVRGRLTGFVDPGPVLPPGMLPVRDFRGWLWQEARCDGSDTGSAEPCKQRSFFSIRLPVDVFRDELFQKPRPVWPPRDLDQIAVQFEMLGPSSATAATTPFDNNAAGTSERDARAPKNYAAATLFDSNAPGATVPLSLNDITLSLLQGETLRVSKVGSAAAPLLTLKGSETDQEISAPWLDKLVQRLPVEGANATAGAGKSIEAEELIHTAVGDYAVRLSGNLRSVDDALSATATRVSWFVLAMLGAIITAWLVIEIGLIRRIAVLTRRAAAVSHNVGDAGNAHVEKRIADLDLSDLRGNDEMGILASGLSDLLQRVKDDAAREHIRTQQERDLWHAVGHEIMSPLQSLMVLHPSADDSSHRYVQRMQQAVRVLYGTASPSEALQAAALNVGTIDLDEFLHNVASNAHFAGIDDVRYQRIGKAVMVRADEFPLEDAVTHILRNADRFRAPGSPIVMTLAQEDATVKLSIHNQGAPIDSARLERIFEYGVSGTPANHAGNETAHRGQGLFVAKTYLAKMGGTVSARNRADGVAFTLSLQRL